LGSEVPGLPSTKLEPTFLPQFGRPVMFVKDHMPFWVYVITEKGNKIKGLRSKSRFWEVKSLEPTFLPKFGRPVMFVIERESLEPTFLPKLVLSA
jgi:hypothetical protein